MKTEDEYMSIRPTVEIPVKADISPVEAQPTFKFSTFPSPIDVGADATQKYESRVYEVVTLVRKAFKGLPCRIRLRWYCDGYSVYTERDIKVINDACLIIRNKLMDAGWIVKSIKVCRPWYYFGARIIHITGHKKM